MIGAVIFPADPEATVFSVTEAALQGMQAGLRLYTDGRRMALLPKKLPGWALLAVKTKPTEPEAA